MTAGVRPDIARAAPRVVVVLPAYLPETFGGAEQQTRRLAQALARRGVSVTLLAPRLEGETPARESEGAVGVRRFRLRAAPNLGGRHLDAFLWWCGCVGAWLWQNRRSYDLIYVVHGRLHAFPAAIAGRWLGKPVVVKPGRGGEAHFDLSVVRRKRLLGPFFAGRIARNTTAWVANSREIAADLARWGVLRERVHVIPNGIDIPDDGRRKAGNGVVRFLSMGRLDSEKAVDQTIRAFAGLPADPPAHLTILGDGPSRPELEALSRRLRQERRIVFTGAVEDVTPYLKEADVYVSTSMSEGMSNALLEAMSSGVMPVVSRVSGADDLVEDGVSGFLFPPGDETALATRLAEVLSMTSERRRVTGEAARAAIRTRFLFDQVVDRHLALYRELIETRACTETDAAAASKVADGG
jgi:glycosyltransferase involved in cell wall biosynthesis